MNVTALLLELIGLYGMLSALIAFGLITSGRVTARGLSYQVLNFTGGIALTYYSLMKTAWASVGLNVAWVCIALFGLYKVYEVYKLKGDQKE